MDKPIPLNSKLDVYVCVRTHIRRQSISKLSFSIYSKRSEFAAAMAIAIYISVLFIYEKLVRSIQRQHSWRTSCRFIVYHVRAAQKKKTTSDSAFFDSIVYNFALSFELACVCVCCIFFLFVFFLKSHEMRMHARVQR